MDFESIFGIAITLAGFIFLILGVDEFMSGNRSNINGPGTDALQECNQCAETGNRKCPADCGVTP